MDASHLARLRQEQDVALQNTEETIAKWEKFKSDYVALQQRLKTLPDKVRHEVMVPFGSLAFMPGQLVHTNEIMVLLGDNWFVERSAKQAAEIVDRRIKSVNKNLDQLYEQRKLLTPRQVFTKELEQIAQGTSDVQDLVEKYDSDTEREWRIQHRKNVRAHREKLRQEVNDHISELQPKQPMDNDALWARLDELEKRETERNELERDEDGDEDDDRDMVRQLSSEGAGTVNRRVAWADEGENEESGTESDDVASTSASDYDTDTEDEVASKQMSRITFTHSTCKKSSSPEDTEDSDSKTIVQKINSPGDIYKHFVQQSKPKSILKQKKGKERVEEERKVAEERKSLEAITTDNQQQAFTGTVVEKSVTSKTVIADGVKVAETASSVTTQPTRPVSRFRAQRQQRGGSNR